LPHAEAELDVHGAADPPDASQLDASEEALTEQHRRREARVDDADAVPAPPRRDEPGPVGRDDARLARQRDHQLAREGMRPRRRRALLGDAGIVEGDRLLEHPATLVFLDERVEARGRLGQAIELRATDEDRSHRCGSITTLPIARRSKTARSAAAVSASA